MYCTYCGHPNKEGNKFCETCGKALESSNPTQPPIGPIPTAGVVGQGKPSGESWLKRMPSLGAAIVILGFFLPWVLVSCNTGFGYFDVDLKASGYEMASGNYAVLQDLGNMYGSDILNTQETSSPLLWFVLVFGVIGLVSLNGRFSGTVSAILAGLLGILSMIIFSVRLSDLGKEILSLGYIVQYQGGYWMTWIGFLWLTLSAILTRRQRS